MRKQFRAPLIQIPRENRKHFAIFIKARKDFNRKEEKGERVICLGNFLHIILTVLTIFSDNM